MSARDIDREIGDLEEFQKQTKICKKIGLPIVGPVYRSWRPSDEVHGKTKQSKDLKKIPTLTLLKETILFIANYDAVTVRQIYYGLVSKQIINNNKAEYNRIERIVKKGRLAGLISFDHVIDDTREAEKTPSWDSMEQIIEVAVDQYRSDWWIDQQYYSEVWLEKRTLRRIFRPITDAYDVHLCIGGGYQSWSEIWEASKRFESRRDQEIVILYFGDLDPSGKDMPRDIKQRFETLKIPLTVKEIALTKQDIQEYKLPRNPTKPTDTREQWYIQKYGINYAVELDALPPDALREKIEHAIVNHMDLGKLSRHMDEDKKEKAKWRELVAG